MTTLIILENLILSNINTLNKVCDITPKVVFLGKELFKALGIL